MQEPKLVTFTETRKLIQHLHLGLEKKSEVKPRGKEDIKLIVYKVSSSILRWMTGQEVDYHEL